MLTLYFVRHAHTEASGQGRWCGSTDVPLDAAGKDLADALAERLGGCEWQALYSSPLKRAMQTVEPLSRRLGMVVKTEDRFRELSYGEWEMLTPDEVRSRDPGRLKAWLADPARIAPPGGETAAATARRVLSAVGAVRKVHPEGRVLVMSHKVTIRLLVCTFLSINLSLYRRRIDLPPGSATIFEFHDNGPRLLRLGDTGHVPDRSVEAAARYSR